MTKITAISNRKGGVGKTTVSLNLAKNLAALGKRVLLVDNDPQGNLTTALLNGDVPDALKATARSPGISNSAGLFLEDFKCEPFKLDDGLYLLGADKHLSDFNARPVEIVFEYSENLELIARDYDHVLIDCLPSFGVLQTAAQVASDYLLVPAHVDSFSVEGLEEHLKTANNMKRRLNPKLTVLGIIVNEASASHVNVDDHFLAGLKKEYGDLVFDVKITRSAKMKEANALGLSVGEYKRYSDQARQYEKITEEFLKRVGADNE